ncbi:MAG TPA: class I SAM-dependent methyltransferase [Candidatus Thermoplasmatota archaeon]|nr:class I SAM-dependent methyltransferase [Candidatus Thermoplasmatota archaeon]
MTLDETTAQEFSEYMKRFPRMYAHLAQTLKRFLSSNPIILDLGTGPGLLSVELLKLIPGARVVGVDPLETMLRLAEQNVRQVPGGSFQTVQGASEHLPLDDSTFDGIVSRFSLPYWQQPDKSFQEMHRVLKPGGIVVLEELNKAFPRWMLTLLTLRMRMRGASARVANYHAEAYPHAHTIEQVIRFFTDAGFTIVETEGKKKEWRFIVVTRKK